MAASPFPRPGSTGAKGTRSSRDKRTSHRLRQARIGPGRRAGKNEHGPTTDDSASAVTFCRSSSTGNEGAIPKMSAGAEVFSNFPVRASGGHRAIDSTWHGTLALTSSTSAEAQWKRWNRRGSRPRGQPGGWKKFASSKGTARGSGIPRAIAGARSVGASTRPRSTCGRSRPTTRIPSGSARRNAAAMHHEARRHPARILGNLTPGAPMRITTRVAPGLPSSARGPLVACRRERRVPPARAQISSSEAFQRFFEGHGLHSAYRRTATGAAHGGPRT